MKKITILLLVTCCVAFSLTAQSTNLQPLVDHLSAILKKEVKVDKDIIRQSLAWEPATPWKMSIAVETGNGKKTVIEKYQFNLSDFNAYLVSRQSKDSYQGVSCRTEKNNDYIEYWEDGAKGSYTNSFLLYFNDVNDADAFAKDFKEAIPLAQDLWNKSIQLPESLTDLQNYLSKQVGNVDYDGEQIKQNLIPDAKIADRASLEVTEDGKSNQNIERFDFSWGDLNPLDISFKTSGSKVYVNFETRRNIRYVQNFSNGEPGGFDNGFRVYVKSPDDAKIFVKAAEKIIPAGEKAIQARSPKVSTFPAALTALNEQLKVFSDKKEKVEQSFSDNCLSSLKVKTTNMKEGESTSTSYQFNWADINPGSVELKISGSGIIVRLAVQQKQNLIALTADGVLQKYTDDLDIQFGDVESARAAQQILTQLIPLCPQATTAAQTPDWMIGALADMPSLKSEVVVALKRREVGKDCGWTLSITNVSEKKGGSEEVWEFDLDRMDSAETKFEVSGKSITLRVPSKFNEKIIKYYKDGKQSFVNKITIPVDSIEKAKSMTQTMKAMIDGCK